jgi:fructose-1,6-bisphosphatase/inositol monophosphatase family enzyme
MMFETHDSVSQLLRDVGDGLLMRNWRKLSADAVREKSKGDFVTDIDEEAERILSAALLALLPGSAVLGEEAASANPELLNLLHGDAPLWVIDPIDGTGNYIDGKPAFAIMVALVMQGQTQAGWIYQPVPQKMFAAQRGKGAFCNDMRLHVVPANHPLGDIHVGISVKYTPEPLRAHIAAGVSHFASHAPFMCAGYEYAALASGDKSMAMFHRLYPWDHLPGLLLTAEAGLVIRHFDGSAYDMRQNRQGIMVAATDALWHSCRDALIPVYLRS